MMDLKARKVMGEQRRVTLGAGGLTVQGATGGNGGGNVGSPIVGTDGANNGAGKSKPANGNSSKK